MNKKALKILLVDDEQSLLNNLIRFFEDEGFEVLAASNSEEALDLLAKEKVDGAIIDMRLPGIDGNEVILRAHDLQPEIKFLIHTGSTNYFLPVSLRAIGIAEDQIYIKPVMDLGLLSEHMQHLLREQDHEK